MLPSTILLILTGLLAILAIYFLNRRYKKVGYLFWKPFAPPSIKISQIAALSPELKLQLDQITASLSYGQKYYPCAVRLEDGQELACVYIIDANEHADRKGELPLDFYHDWISIEKVTAITESPFRLPLPLAQALYDHGESAMGAYYFTVEFSNGARLSYATGGLLDFLDIPKGLKPSEAVKVLPKTTLPQEQRKEMAYRWCIFRGNEL